MKFPIKEPIEKGWSADQKYRVTDSRGENYLLRVSPVEKKERLEALFRILHQAECLGVPMNRPVDIALQEDGVYTLYTWVEGADAELAVPQKPAAEQYFLGREAGHALHLLHQIPAADDLESWEDRFNRKIDRKIQMCRHCPIEIPGAESMIRFIEENRHLLRHRPQCFQHGDYHIGNMMLQQDKIVIIDFDRFDFGDPWEEFNRIVWSAQAAPDFASGLLDGYFSDHIPEAFWRLMALYVACNQLSSVPWAIPFGEQEIQVMLNQATEVLRWYHGMNEIVPGWYNHRSHTCF